MQIAIHQPNFMPWYPFFQKMERVDLFVVLTHCQYEKGGYQNRFQVDGRWYTMSVQREDGREIREKMYHRPQDDWRTIWSTLERRHPAWPTTVLSHFGAWQSLIHESLWATNLGLIRRLAGLLGIKTPVTLDFPTNLTGTERLIEICRTYGADSFYTGQGGQEWIDREQFRRAGIGLEFQEDEDMDRRPVLEVLHERMATGVGVMEGMAGDLS